MINKKKFSFQFLSSEKLHQVNFSISNFLIFFTVFTVSFIAINYSLTQKFSDEYYKEKLKQTDEKYSAISQELIDKISKLEQELKLIEEKDSELRTYATLAPLSDDVKAKGVGGSTIEDSSTEDLDGSSIMLLKDRVDSLAFAVDIQKDSYNTIFNKIKSNEKMFRHIPSIAPVKGYIGSRYGYRTDPIDGKRRMHSGLDFPVNLNTDVVATGDGVVTKAQYDSGWGRYIKIDHGYGYETIYAHLWKINVKKGQKVKRGDKIGKSGNSGRAAGFHLHYEVHKNNKTVDPLRYFFSGYIDWWILL